MKYRLSITTIRNFNTVADLHKWYELVLPNVVKGGAPRQIVTELPMKHTFQFNHHDSSGSVSTRYNIEEIPAPEDEQ